MLPKIKSDQITILSFFVIGEFNDHQDRYYPGLLEDLSDEYTKILFIFFLCMIILRENLREIF